MMNQNGMDPQDQRNFIIAMVLMVAFVFLYQTVVINPEQEARRAAEAAAELEQQAAAPDAPLVDAAPIVAATVEEALGQSQRLAFDADRVDGSIRLAGATIDDLSLKDHYKTIERTEELRLLRPQSAEHGFYGSWYWLEGGRAFAGPNDVWTLVGNGALSTQNSVSLVLEKEGLRFQRELSVDENYMFTFADTVTNLGEAPRTLTPYGSIRRHGAWKGFLEATDPGSSRKMGLAHQGLIGVVDDRLKLRKYSNLAKGKGLKGAAEDGTLASPNGGWLGFTDMYWMAALVPQQDRTFTARFQQIGPDQDIMELSARTSSLTLQPGQSLTSNNQIFAGAKEYEVVKSYESTGIPRFDDSIDWGNILYYITRPFFSLLNWLQNQLGSFGLAILALTVLVRFPLIPLYNQSYKSMAKMKKLAEPMKEIQERFKGDPQRRQQEVMKLYQKEKANPLAGCVPILLTIPVFFALYKVLYVTIEMRHTPFLWLPDLSAAEPWVLGNLFGLADWATGDEIRSIFILGFILGIGILAVLYGVTMAAIQALSPPPPDPTQRKIMMFLPFVFMFVFGGFASGLVLYWVWSNILSLLQQYFIMRRNGVETELDKLIKRLMGREQSPAE